MTEIVVTEKEKNVKYLLYLQKNLAEIFNQTQTLVKCYKNNQRAVLELEVQDLYKDLIINELIDKIADVIVVGYKYVFLKDKVKPMGLNDDGKNLLLAGIISADIDDDKKYVISKIKGFDSIAIDGVYNFRLKILKEKWFEISSLMPTAFMPEQLKEFLSYISGGRKERIFIDGEAVYDSHYRRQIKSELTESPDALTEVVLCGASEINLLSSPDKRLESGLMSYYGSKVNFVKKG